MKKKFVLSVIAIMLVAAALVGCTVTTSSSKTESTVTTSVEKSNGEAAAKSGTQIGAKVGTDAASKSTAGAVSDKAGLNKLNSATIAFVNECGVDLHQLFFASSASDQWGDEWLGDSAPLEDGYTITFEGKFKYAANDTKWDMMVADSQGETLQFSGIDVTKVDNPKELTIILFYNDAEDTYTITVQ